MDTSRIRANLRKRQSALITNHSILVMQILMLIVLKTPMAVMCTLITALACGMVWHSVFRK